MNMKMNRMIIIDYGALNHVKPVLELYTTLQRLN